MRIPRIFYPFELEPNSEIKLNISSSNHLKVINVKINKHIEVFNGKGFFCKAVVKKIEKKIIFLELNSKINFSKINKLQINLAISEIKNFDKIVRESCQLGVTKISCLESARSKFKNLPSTKKILRWEAISISACEQCGLNWKPEISSMTLNEWVENSNSESKILLNPKSSDTLKSIEASNSFDLAIGPEGGFSEEEIIFFEKNNFKSISCGDLILKTETMPVVVLSMVKALFGDI
ncbi:MAG: RsmE family RNA methyltransferase [Gammaproteobacteria bacterium]|mgnify:FL=1